MDNNKVIERKLLNVDSKICLLIDEIDTHDRLWVSDMVLQFLRTFVEHVNARVYADDNSDKEVIIGKKRISDYNNYVKNCGKYPFLKELLDSLNKTVSHFVPENDSAERLMLMYYPNLLHVKKMMKERFGLELLRNIKKIPTDIDKSLDVYYNAISKKLISFKEEEYKILPTRYYVLNSKPIIVEENVFYEVTLTLARGKISKINKFVVFSKENIPDNYSVQVELVKHKIEVNGFKMPVQFLLAWRISIRPCELERIVNICGGKIKISSNSKFYGAIMNCINMSRKTILDELLSNDDSYLKWKKTVKLETVKELDDSFSILREVLLKDGKGSNIIRYFLSCLRNDIIKDQLWEKPNNYLSNLFLRNESIPFDNMPYATSLYKHNVNFSQLINCIEIEGRDYEFLAREVNEEAYNNNTLYLDKNEMLDYSKVLMEMFNDKLYTSKKQQQRRIETFSHYLCIKHKVDETYNIIQKLKEYGNSGLENYKDNVKDWIEQHEDIDDDSKKMVLRNLYSCSKVGLIYGAAGTGKTKVIEYVTNYFYGTKIICLANTHPAVDNLRQRTNYKFTYKTIRSYLESRVFENYDLMIIDECSMVSNKDIYNILEKNNVKFLLLVGDVYQIESIEFGNWFNFARYFIDRNSVHELKIPYRAKNNKELMDIWNAVRTYNENMFLKMQEYNCVEDLNDEIFNKSYEDEIVLCLGYNGIYGINNLNRFLQSNNPFPAVEWGVWEYKVNDPILFIENQRFDKILYNNLKGRIIDINVYDNAINFVVEVEKHYEKDEFIDYDIDLVEYMENGNTVVSFYVYDEKEIDDDENNYDGIVPFQIAYAVSIHKAQGLEYDSVKVVITKDVEERITHSIFYTAITRAKKALKVYMSAEIQKNLVDRFVKNNNGLKQAKIFAGHNHLKLKNKLES